MVAQGREGVKELLKIIASEQDARLLVDAHASLVVLATGLHALQTMIGSIERRIVAQHRSDEASKRLRSTPGIAIVGATTIAATVPDPKVFRSGRDFAAWIGIVPRRDSTGGKQKLGPISSRFSSLSINSRARGPRRLSAVDSATRWGRHLAAVADSIFGKSVGGERWSSGAGGDRCGAGELPGHRQTRGIETPAV